MHSLPQELEPFIRQMVSLLDLSDMPILLPILPDEDTIELSCFDNVKQKIARSGGNIKYGWILHVEPFMITAEFHAIWESPGGLLRDITPDMEAATTSRLFVFDKNRTFSGERIENVMLNISGSVFIYDYIELQKACHRFLEAEERKEIIGLLELQLDEQIKWDIMHYWSNCLLKLFYQQAEIDDACFCGNEAGYTNCHQKFIKQLMLQI